MKRRIITALLALSLLLMSSCGGSGGESVIVAGSTSVQPYVEILIEEYMRRFPDSRVRIQGGGSSAGILAVESGIADIGMSSRALSEREAELFGNIIIAKDGLAIIVHPDNPVSDLTLEQVRGIYTRQITNWSQVGGLDARIHIVTREQGSGTRSAFQDLVMDGETISQRAIVQNSNGAVRLLVSGNRDTIGFISLGLVELDQADIDAGMKPVKPLSLGGIEPTQDNVLDDLYGLFREFIFVFTDEQSPNVKHFIEFVLSSEGQQILIEEGLISISGRAGE